ncbi:FadR/GntR family transcriptional regulator [soil metagenome]
MRRANLHDHIVDALGVRIVRGDFTEGDALPNEPTLAAELGVSRNALREAIKVLARKGLVEVRQKTGTKVLPRENWSLLDRDVLGWVTDSGQELHHAMGLVEFRLIFEPRASYLAAIRASADEITAISSACEKLEASIGAPLDIMSEYDLNFHLAILRASHNEVLMHLGSLVASLMKIQVVATSQDRVALEVGIQQHRELADAIANRDAVRAESVSRSLVLSPYDKLADLVGLAPDLRLK